MPSIEKMVEHAIAIANDDSHGYSQADRWNIDRDCSSLMYESGYVGGYNLNRYDPRYTGTMIRDFSAVGFEVIPFANVGLGGLKRGDILLNVSYHTEMCIGGGKFVGAHSSENGGIYGQPGDQTGREISIVPAYDYDPWNYVLRPPADEAKEEDLKPVYNDGGVFKRYYDPKTENHVYTRDSAEEYALKKSGWKDEGIAWTAKPSQQIPVYRLTYAKTGDHMWTAAYLEAERCAKGGWTYEGVPFFASASGTPIYRLVNKKTGLHHWTADANEHAQLSKGDWKSEGVAFHV